MIQKFSSFYSTSNINKCSEIVFPAAGRERLSVVLTSCGFRVPGAGRAQGAMVSMELNGQVFHPS